MVSVLRELAGLPSCCVYTSAEEGVILLREPSAERHSGIERRSTLESLNVERGLCRRA